MMDKQIIEALANAAHEMEATAPLLPEQSKGDFCRAAANLRTALSRASQPATAERGEVVAWRYQFKQERPLYFPESERKDWAVSHPLWIETPLYAHPPATADRDVRAENERLRAVLLELATVRYPSLPLSVVVSLMQDTAKEALADDPKPAGEVGK